MLEVMIAAPASGSGKTSVTCGLLQALKDRGLAPAAFKCGPDYIDPMFHRSVLQVPSRNLDVFSRRGRADARAVPPPHGRLRRGGVRGRDGLLRRRGRRDGARQRVACGPARWTCRCCWATTRTVLP